MPRSIAARSSWLLLHGTPLNAAVWDGVRSQLSLPSVAPELHDLVDAASKSTDVQRDVANALISHLPAGRYRVVGHSFGGQVALEFAQIAPEMVEHLIILCSRHTPFPAFADLASTVEIGGGPDVEQSLARWFTEDELEADGDAVHYARAQLQRVDRRSWSNALAAIATYDRADNIGSVRTPTTALCAGLDKVSTPDAMAALAAALPHGSLRIIDEWAHMSPFVDPTELARLLEAAVTEHRRPTSRP